MKHIIAALALLIAGASGASAQQSRWTDPTGSWSIDFTSVRWGRADGLGPNGPLLLIAPAIAPSDNDVRICFIEQAPAVQAAETLETSIAQLDATSAPQLFPRAQLSDARVTPLSIGGHAVAAVDAASRGNAFKARAFATRSGDQVFTTTISCILSSGIRADLAAEVDSIFQSLQFASVDTQP
jgi:hypothetical protein